MGNENEEQYENGNMEEEAIEGDSASGKHTKRNSTIIGENCQDPSKKIKDKQQNKKRLSESRSLQKKVHNDVCRDTESPINPEENQSSNESEQQIEMTPENKNESQIIAEEEGNKPIIKRKSKKNSIRLNGESGDPSAKTVEESQTTKANKVQKAHKFRKELGKTYTENNDKSIENANTYSNTNEELKVSLKESEKKDLKAADTNPGAILKNETDGSPSNDGYTNKADPTTGNLSLFSPNKRNSATKIAEKTLQTAEEEIKIEEQFKDSSPVQNNTSPQSKNNNQRLKRKGTLRLGKKQEATFTYSANEKVINEVKEDKNEDDDLKLEFERQLNNNNLINESQKNKKVEVKKVSGQHTGSKPIIIYIV